MDSNSDKKDFIFGAYLECSGSGKGSSCQNSLRVSFASENSSSDQKKPQPIKRKINGVNYYFFKCILVRFDDTKQNKLIPSHSFVSVKIQVWMMYFQNSRRSFSLCKMKLFFPTL